MTEASSSSTIPPSSSAWKNHSHRPHLKLDKFPKLTNQTDYPVWRDTARYVLGTMDCWSLVEDTEAQPVKTKNQDDKDYEETLGQYKARYQWASIFFLETVDQQWLPIITAAQTPSRIWKALQDKYRGPLVAGLVLT